MAYNYLNLGILLSFCVLVLSIIFLLVSTFELGNKNITKSNYQFAQSGTVITTLSIIISLIILLYCLYKSIEKINIKTHFAISKNL